MVMTQTDQEKLQRLHEIRASRLAWRLTYPHAHAELRDPLLRSILANELWILRLHGCCSSAWCDASLQFALLSMILIRELGPAGKRH